jgi:hypothetical protein
LHLLSERFAISTVLNICFPPNKIFGDMHEIRVTCSN